MPNEDIEQPLLKEIPSLTEEDQDSQLLVQVAHFLSSKDLLNKPAIAQSKTVDCCGHGIYCCVGTLLLGGGTVITIAIQAPGTLVPSFTPYLIVGCFIVGAISCMMFICFNTCSGYRSLVIDRAKITLTLAEVDEQKLSEVFIRYDMEECKAVTSTADFRALRNKITQAQHAIQKYEETRASTATNLSTNLPLPAAVQDIVLSYLFRPKIRRQQANESPKNPARCVLS